jgi:hypothetical protein
MVVGCKTTYAISAYPTTNVMSSNTTQTRCTRYNIKTQVFSTNKTDRHDITEILLKVVLNAIDPPLYKSEILTQQCQS